MLNMLDFKSGYDLGLVFAMIDGLCPGEHIVVLCKPEDLTIQEALIRMKVPHIKWETKKRTDSRREITVRSCYEE